MKSSNTNSIIIPDLILSETLLSFIIPTYNRDNYLMQTLENIRGECQGHKDRVEVVVGNNDSDDNTEQVVKSFEGLPIEYFRNERNVGGVENVLRCCEQAKGRFVFLFADDDLLHPGSVKAVLECLLENPDLAVVSGPLTNFIDGNPPFAANANQHFPSSGEQIRLRSGEEALTSLFSRASSLVGLIIRSDLLDIDGARRHSDSHYPQIYLVGHAVKMADACYLPKALVSVRNNPVTHWSFCEDYFSSNVMKIMHELTADVPWGRNARLKIVRKRVWAAYNPLFKSREKSFSSFLNVVRAFAKVVEYRSTLHFWGLVFFIGLFGVRGVQRIKGIISGTQLHAIKGTIAENDIKL
jgi:glycosyltransferase involved in cell wall biosynthesis